MDLKQFEPAISVSHRSEEELQYDHVGLSLDLSFRLPDRRGKLRAHARTAPDQPTAP